LTPKHLKKNAKTSNEIKTPMPPLSLSPFLSLSQQNPGISVTISGDSITISGDSVSPFFYHTQSKKSILMPQKSILMLQILFFDSNLKPRIGRLTLEDLITLTPKNMTVGTGEGEHEDPRRRPMPETHAHHLRPVRSDPRPAAPWVFFSASLSLSLASLCPSLSQLALSPGGRPGWVIRSSFSSSFFPSSFFPQIKREKSSVFGLHKFFAIFLLYMRCLIFIGWQKTFPLRHDRT
jgi:hypothetical protein